MPVDPLAEGMRSEQVHLSAHPHWCSLLRHGAAGVAMAASGLALMLFGGKLSTLVEGLVPSAVALPGGEAAPGSPAGLPPDLGFGLSMLLNWTAAALVLLGSIILGWALLQRHFTQYAITTSYMFGGRIVKVQGILSRQTVAVPLGMVNDLVLHEPLLGRLLGWGHIDIETGNDYQGDRLLFMPDPRAVYEIWAALLASGYGSSAGSGLPSARGHYPGRRT